MTIDWDEPTYGSISSTQLAELESDLFGDGYALVPKGDTLQAGDEFYNPCKKVWAAQPEGAIGETLELYHWVTRRPLVVGMILTGGTYSDFDKVRLDQIADELAQLGYTLLHKGDTIQPGDEYLRCGDTVWRDWPDVYPGTQVDESYCITRRAGVAQYKAAKQPATDETEGDRLMRFFFGCGQ